MSTTDTQTGRRRDELVERLFGAALGTFDLFAVYLRCKLGYYGALAAAARSTAASYASR